MNTTGTAIHGRRDVPSTPVLSIQPQHTLARPRAARRQRTRGISFGSLDLHTSKHDRYWCACWHLIIRRVMYVDAAQYLPEHSRGWSLDLGIADISENSNRSSISARATAVAGATTQIKTVGMPLVEIAHGVYIGKVACDIVGFFPACVVHAQPSILNHFCITPPEPRATKTQLVTSRHESPDPRIPANWQLARDPDRVLYWQNGERG